MADDDLEHPRRGYDTKDVETMHVETRRRRRKWPWLLLAGLIVVPALVLALWTWVTLSYTYSEGERAGYVQKFSRKGWLCKTWEGELAMVNLPGAMPQIFHFSVRDPRVANELRRTEGARVLLSYEEHRGIPTTCFGETDYFATGVRLIGQ